MARSGLSKKIMGASHDCPPSVSRMLIQLLDHWGLDSEEQLSLLGLSDSERSVLAEYRSGQPINNNQETLERAGHLLAIHRRLRILFPRNQDLAYRWISTRNKAFEGRSPAEVIREYGFSGLLMVRSYLDRMRDQ